MSETEYKAVRGLMRGLALINGLNRFDGGATTAQLAEQSGLHRTTVRRLLETLQTEGYVRRSESDDSYRLTLKVRELSEDFATSNGFLRLPHRCWANCCNKLSGQPTCARWTATPW
jgi:DNA-binding IclR family transcriptional regulator